MFPAVRFRLETLEECPSTQELVLARRGTPEFHGSAVLTRRQTAGYGRRGRSWQGGEGNLALSFGLELPEAALPLLPFACGLAAFQACHDYLPEGADLRLKWPNDLYLNGRKLAGLIAQGRQVPTRGTAEVVVGLGVNLREAPAIPDQATTALGEGAPSPEEFAETFLRTLEAVFLEATDFHLLREEWERAARFAVSPLRIVGEEGEYAPQALLSTGELLVRDANGATRKLASEDVSIRFV